MGRKKRKGKRRGENGVRLKKGKLIKDEIREGKVKAKR